MAKIINIDTGEEVEQEPKMPDMNCCICKSDIIDNINITTCGHTFHSTCLLKWISNNKSSCPMCRKKLV